MEPQKYTHFMQLWHLLLGGSCYDLPHGRHSNYPPQRDMRHYGTATLLTEICHNVATEPPLQPLTNESFVHRSANTEPNARLDIRARGFWNTGQDAIFDVRVFYPNASSNRSMTTTAAYRKHESAKEREYAQRIREVEMVFSHLSFSQQGAAKLQHFIRDWQMEFPGRSEKNILCRGYGMDSLSSLLCNP